MAKVTQSDILQLAKLARLDLSKDEIEKFSDEISNILAYVEKLQAVDIGKHQPTYQVTGLKNVTRPDKPINYGASQKDLLKNVPALDGDYIKVKRVL